MKRLLNAVAWLLVAAGTPVFAGGSEPVRFATTTLTNSATVQVSNIATSDATFYGCLDYVYFDLSGYASPTVTVSVATVGHSTSPARTLLTVSGITADGAYSPRIKVCNTAASDSTDGYAEIPLYGDKLEFRAYNANVTNAITITAYVYVEKE